MGGTGQSRQSGVGQRQWVAQVSQGGAEKAKTMGGTGQSRQSGVGQSNGWHRSVQAEKSRAELWVAQVSSG